MGDVDFEEYMDNINIKVKSNTQLTHFEEITLLLMALNYDFKDKLGILKKLSKLIVNKELFDESKFEFIQTVVDIEIRNLLTKDEQKEIKEEIEMTPEAMAVVRQAIEEVNQKVLAENREDAYKECRAKTMEEVAKTFRDEIDLDKLSKFTGLTVDEIKKL